MQYLPGGSDESFDVSQDIFGVVFFEGDAAVTGAFGCEGEVDAVCGCEGGYFFNVGDGCVFDVVVGGGGGG